jgi:hypothetical protein
LLAERGPCGERDREGGERKAQTLERAHTRTLH